MSTLGELEVIRADKSFDEETMGPTLPGSDRRRSGMTSRMARRPKAEWDIDDMVAASLDESRDAAYRDVAFVRSSTTLVALASALESAGDSKGSIEAATESLELSLMSVSGGEPLLDPVSSRLAIEILLRAGMNDDAIRFAHALPFTGQVRLSIGAMLATVGRTDDAHAFIDRSNAEGHDAVLGFLQVMEGNNQAAISSLRAALRDAPDDADSALNLSIAFWRVGARKKAISAALQATRSAPGRQDVGLHYLELLFAERDLERFDREVEVLAKRGVVPSARLYVLRARATLVRGDIDAGIKLLDLALDAAKAEHDDSISAEIQGNLIRIRAWHGRLSRDVAMTRLVQLHGQFPDSAVVVVSMAQVANRRSHADALGRALDKTREWMAPSRVAFVEHQLASLVGNNELAAQKAVEWFTLEPEDLNASMAAVVALGIGQERWNEAAEFVRASLAQHPEDTNQFNNAAYVLAMVGDAEEAIQLLTPHANGNLVMTATLGLAYLASGQVGLGMKLYREAAKVAEREQDGSRSLMTAYQAMVVRQLGLLDTNDPLALSAMSLAPVSLPDDWRERPEFLRLHTLALSKGYGWPLTL